MNKQPEVTDATRESFVTAFFQIAKIKKIHQITIREIANLAGHNRTTFYHYFKDVYALIEYAEDDFFRSTQRALLERSNGDDLYDGRFFETFISCFRKSPERITVLMSEENRTHFIQRMRDNTTVNSKIRIANTPKKEVITDMFFFGVFSAVAIHLQNEETLSNDDLLEIIQKLFTGWYWPQIEEGC